MLSSSLNNQSRCKQRLSENKYIFLGKTSSTSSHYKDRMRDQRLLFTFCTLSFTVIFSSFLYVTWINSLQIPKKGKNNGELISSLVISLQ